MPPKLYGWEHIVYIAVFFVALAACVVIAQFVTKTEKQRSIMLKIIGGLLVASLLFNRIALSVWHKSAIWLLPNSYCGMSSLLLGAFVVFGKPRNRIYDFLFYLELFGGISCVFYPYFIGQGDSIFFPPTISGLLHHSIGFILCVLMAQCKWFSPSLKRWKEFPIGLSIYTLYGLFLIDVCGVTEAMQIDAPIIAGTPLKWWFILIVGSAVLFAYLFCLEKYRAHSAKKKLAAQNEQPSADGEQQTGDNDGSDK